MQPGVLLQLQHWGPLLPHPWHSPEQANVSLGHDYVQGRLLTALLQLLDCSHGPSADGAQVPPACCHHCGRKLQVFVQRRILFQRRRLILHGQCSSEMIIWSRDSRPDIRASCDTARRPAGPLPFVPGCAHQLALWPGPAGHPNLGALRALGLFFVRDAYQDVIQDWVNPLIHQLQQP